MRLMGLIVSVLSVAACGQRDVETRQPKQPVLSFVRSKMIPSGL